MYLKLEDATSLLFQDGVTRVQAPTDFLAWQAEHVARRGIARVVGVSADVWARVNHGRWLADCQRCGQGMFTHPEWRIACCAECGAVYRGVVFPEAIADITRLLLQRPRRDTQNWEPGESLTRLRFENLLHRLAA